MKKSDQDIIAQLLGSEVEETGQFESLGDMTLLQEGGEPVNEASRFVEKKFPQEEGSELHGKAKGYLSRIEKLGLKRSPNEKDHNVHGKWQNDDWDLELRSFHGGDRTRIGFQVSHKSHPSQPEVFGTLGGVEDHIAKFHTSKK